MRLRCKINNEEYDVCQGVPFSDEYNETLDSGTIIIDQVPKLKNLRPYDDVVIWDADYEYLGYNEDGEPLFNGYTFESWDVLSGFPVYQEGKTIFFKHLLVDGFSEDIINLCGREDGKSIYKYKIQLFSETKGLEVVQLPNISITEPLNINKKISVWEYMNKYIDLYSPKYKRKKKNDDGTYSEDEWEFVSKYRLSSSLRNIFSTTYSPDFDLNGENLKGILSKFMETKDMIPYVKNGVIYAIDQTQRNGGFDNNPENVNFITGNYTSSNYCDSLRTTYSNAISDDNSCRFVEFMGFRNYDSSLMTIKNMRLETQYPIYKINKIYMCYYKRYNVYDENEKLVEKNSIFLCKQDITPLVKLNTERNLLSQDWNAMNTLSYANTINDFAKFKMMTVGYDIGSNHITGWGEKYKYPEKKVVSVWDIEKTYIQNIINVIDALSPFGINENETLLKKYPKGKYKISFNKSKWTNENGIENIISPFTNESLKLKSFFFEMDYQGFYNGAVVHSKDIGRDDIVINNNPNSGLVMLEKDGLYQKEQLNRFGNKVVTITARYEDISQLQPLGSVLDLEDEKDIIIYHREYSIYDNMILATYIGSQDYVLKNYHTSVYAKHRTWSLMNYNEAVTRAENKKMFIVLDKNKFFYENNMDFLTNISYDLIQQFISFYPRENSEIKTIGIIKYDDNCYAVDMNKFVSGYSICFNVSMKDSLSPGMYISIPMPDMNDDWDLANKLEEKLTDTNLNVKQILLYSLMDGVEGDYTGSLQDWYSLIDDKDTGFSKKLGFYVLYLDKKNEYDKLYSEDDIDYIKSDIYQDLFRLPLITHKFFVKETTLPKGVYNKYLNNKVLEDNKEIKKLITQKQDIILKYREKKFVNTGGFQQVFYNNFGGELSTCGIENSLRNRIYNLYFNDSNKMQIISIFSCYKTVYITRSNDDDIEIEYGDLNFNFMELGSSYDYISEVSDLTPVSSMTGDRFEREIMEKAVYNSDSYITKAKENHKDFKNFVTNKINEIKNEIPKERKTIMYVPVIKFSFTCTLINNSNVTENGVLLQDQLLPGWNLRLSEPQKIVTTDSGEYYLKYYDEVDLKKIGVEIELQNGDFTDGEKIVLGYESPLDNNQYIGNDYELWKDNKEKIDMTYQIEPITADENILFSPWLVKLSDINSSYERHDVDIIKEADYSDTNVNFQSFIFTYKDINNSKKTCPLVFLRISKKYFSALTNHASLDISYNFGVRKDKENNPFVWLREIYRFENELSNITTFSDNELIINSKETFHVHDVGENRKHTNNRERHFVKSYEDEEYIVFSCVYEDVKKMYKKMGSDDNDLYYDEDDVDDGVGRYLYTFTATNYKDIKSSKYSDEITENAEIISKNLADEIFFSKNNPSVFKNMFIVTSKEKMKKTLVYDKYSFANEYLNYTYYKEGDVVIYDNKLHMCIKENNEPVFKKSYWQDISDSTYLKDGHLYKLNEKENYWESKNINLTQLSVSETLAFTNYKPIEEIEYKTVMLNSFSGGQYIDYEKLANFFKPGKYSFVFNWENGANHQIYDEILEEDVYGYFENDNLGKVTISKLLNMGICPKFVEYVKENPEDTVYYSSYKTITIDFEVLEYSNVYYPLGQIDKKKYDISIYLNNRGDDETILYKIENLNQTNATILDKWITKDSEEENNFNIHLRRDGNIWVDDSNNELSYQYLTDVLKIKPKTSFVYSAPKGVENAKISVDDTASVSGFSSIYISYEVKKDYKPYLFFEDDIYNTDEPIKSIQYWYANGDSLEFVFGVNITDEDKERGYIKIYTSLLSSRDTRVYDENHNLIGEIQNYADKDNDKEYGKGQYFKKTIK